MEEEKKEWGMHDEDLVMRMNRKIDGARKESRTSKEAKLDDCQSSAMEDDDTTTLL